MGIRLSGLASGESVENVVIFVSDSFRDDFLPDSIASMGVRAHGIAPSTYTASSFPSILTGQYPVEHGLWNFSAHLPRKPYLLRTADSGGVDVDNVWRPQDENDEKPTVSVLNLDGHTPFEDLTPPFTFVVHDHGGHSPYGGAGDGFTSTTEFFRENDFDRQELIARYEDGVSASVRRFRSLYERLQDRSLLSDTLVVFTSDHGELLGEYGGLYGHTSPMVPETLTVPIVFCGTGLPDEEATDECLSSLDLAPTVLSAQGRTVPGRMRGRDLWSGSQSRDGPIRADVWRETRFGDKIDYAASSVWDENGGVVVHRGSRLGRTAFAVGTNVYLAPHAPLVRRRPLRNLRSLLAVYAPVKVEYGSYTGDVAPAAVLEDDFERRQETATDDVDRERLAALGYVR